MRFIMCTLFLFACSSSDDSMMDPPGDDDPLPPPEPDKGFQLKMEATAPPASEVWKCGVTTIPFVERVARVHSVKSLQTPGLHHMDIMLLLESEVARMDPGVYDCADLYERSPELMEEVIIYASQNESQELVLPPGIVAEVPTFLPVMYEIHYVNSTDTEQQVFSKVNAYTIPDDQVTGNIWGSVIRDLELTLPPHTEVEEWTRCVLNKPIDLLFLSTHTHELATQTVVSRFKDGQVGEVLYTNEMWDTPFVADFAQAPLHMEAGEGFELRCKYNNTKDEPVAWGFQAKDEMCNLAFVHTPGDTSIQCDVVESGVGP